MCIVRHDNAAEQDCHNACIHSKLRHMKTVCVQLRASSDNVALPHLLHGKAAAEQSIDISCSMANSSSVQQTDGQTLYHYIDPALHTRWAVPISKYQQFWVNMYSK